MISWLGWVRPPLPPAPTSPRYTTPIALRSGRSRALVQRTFSPRFRPLAPWLRPDFLAGSGDENFGIHVDSPLHYKALSPNHP